MTSHLPLSPAARVNAMLALIALNVGLGAVVSALKIPLYLDAIGTILGTLLLGWRLGAVVGVASFLVGGLLLNPVLPWFSGTQAIIALYTGLVARRGWLSGWPKVLIAGIVLGIVAGAVSAPVIVKLFGGLTGSGPSLVVGYLLATGRGLFKAVFLSGLASEPLDKSIQLLLAVWLFQSLPKRIRNRYVTPQARVGL